MRGISWLAEKWLASIKGVSKYRGADKSLARPTSRCILFDGENISFDTSLVVYIHIYMYTTNIPPIMILNRINQWQTTAKNLPRMQRPRAIPVAWLSSGLCPDRPKGWIPIIIIIIIIIIIWISKSSVAVACFLPCRAKDLSAPLIYRGVDKSLARPTSRCILFDGENISFDVSLVICI